MNQQQIQRLREIISRVVDNDTEWLSEKNINISSKPLFWMLNYGIGSSNDYNRLTRALVIVKSGEFADPLDRIVSFPFVRFFNRHENPANHVELAESEMIEKMDGTFVCAFRHNHKIYYHTRRLCSSSPDDMKLMVTGFHGGKYNFLEEIGKHVVDLVLSHHITYMFEFIHPMTRVLTEYTPEQTGLYLIGVRMNADFSELSESNLDDYVADTLNVARPRRWNGIGDSDAIVAKIAEISEDTPKFEGFVFRDIRTGHRVKVKSEEYVKFHHILSRLCYKNLLGVVLSGEESEVLSYFPDARPRIELIQEKFSAYLDYLQSRRVHWLRSDLTKKELALKLLGTKPKRWENSEKVPGAETPFVASQILSTLGMSAARSRQVMSDYLTKFVLGHNKNPNKVLNLIGLQESEEL